MNLDPTISEWLNLIFRWVHVFAGIMWVGTTYYFTWLDARLTEEEKAALNTGNAAQIWMVHSGGFYLVEKRKVPDELSRKLHWFRWEAGTTWLSGMALLILMFYIGGGSGLIGDAEISPWVAIAVGLGTLIGGWLVYDLMNLSPLGKNEKAFAVIAYVHGGGVGVRSYPRAQRQGGIHSRRRDVWHDHGRECLDANSARSAEDDRGNQGRPQTRRCACRPRRSFDQNKTLSWLCP